MASAETCRKSAPFRAGSPPLARALSAPLQGGLRVLRLSSTPSAVTLPCGRASVLRRDEWGLPCCPRGRCDRGGCTLGPEDLLTILPMHWSAGRGAGGAVVLEMMPCDPRAPRAGVLVHALDRDHPCNLLQTLQPFPQLWSAAATDRW